MKESAVFQKETEEEDVPTQEMIEEIPTQEIAIETNVEKISENVSPCYENDYNMDCDTAYDNNQEEQGKHSPQKNNDSSNGLPPKDSPLKSFSPEDSPKKTTSPQISPAQITSISGVFSNLQKESIFEVEPIKKQINQSQDSSLVSSRSIIVQEENSPKKNFDQSEKQTVTNKLEKSPSSSPKKSSQSDKKSPSLSPKKTSKPSEESYFEASPNPSETFIESTIPDESNSSINASTEPVANNIGVYDNLVKTSYSENGEDSGDYLDHINSRKTNLHNSNLDLDSNHRATSNHRASTEHTNSFIERDSNVQKDFVEENLPSTFSELDSIPSNTNLKSSTACETFSVKKLNNPTKDAGLSIPFNEFYDNKDTAVSKKIQFSPNKNDNMLDGSINDSDNDKTLKTNKENNVECNLNKFALSHFKLKNKNLDKSRLS